MDNSLLKDQLSRTMYGEAWHGPAVLEALEGIFVQQAINKPIADGHSVWEIILHLTAWQEIVATLLRGQATSPTPEQEWPIVPEPTNVAWQTTKTHLLESHQALLKLIETLTPAQLVEPIPGRPPGQEKSKLFLLLGLVQHNVYHAGQIVLLKKML